MLWAGFSLLLLTVLYPVRPSVITGLAGRMLARLGRISYAFYLWHFPVMACMGRLLIYAVARGIHVSTVSLLFTMVLTFGVTVLVALVTTSAVENPFLQLRDRWVPSLIKSPVFQFESAQSQLKAGPGTLSPSSAI
jgi:peptidoglycan/LPS O-acetylase OafA/YrhL